MNETIKTLTVRQPWAWLIGMGHKTVENRSWSTPYRGPILIQASAGYGNLDDLSATCDWVEDETGLILPLDFPLGCSVCLVTLTDIRRDQTGFWPEPGQNHWILENPIMLPHIPMKGRLNLWNFDFSSLENDQLTATVKEYTA